MAANRTCPSAGSSRRPRYQSRYMLKAMWRKPACRKPPVIRRQYSWSIEIDGPNNEQRPSGPRRLAVALEPHLVDAPPGRRRHVGEIERGFVSLGADRGVRGREGHLRGHHARAAAA